MGSTPARKSKSLWDDKRETRNVWLSIADMPSSLHAVANDSKEYVSDAAAKSMKVVPAGTLLVSFKLTLGRLCYAGRDLFTNEAIAALLNLDERAVTKEFLYWYLTFFDWHAAAAGDEKVKGKTLNKAKLKELEVGLPPLEEQKRIVAVLDQAFAALDRARALAEGNLADAEALLSQTVEAALCAFGEPQPIGQHLDLLSGFAFKSGGYTDDPEDVRLIRGDNIVQGAFRWDGVKRWSKSERSDYARYELAADDVLIAMDRTWVSAGIKYAVVDEEALPSLLVQRVARLRTKSTLLPSFLAICIGSKHFERYVLDIQTGLGVPHVSGKQLEAFEVAIPDLDAQQEFVDRIEAIRGRSKALTANLRASLSDIAQLRQSLLQKAFAGELT